MPTVCLNGCDLPVEAAQGETLLSCIRRNGFKVESTCDGQGVCGKCRVIVHGELSPPDEVELEHLSGQPGNIRLACRAKVVGDLTVTLGETWTQIHSAPESKCRTVALDSLLKRVTLPDEVESQRPYAETLPFKISDPRVPAKIAARGENSNQAFGIVFGNELLDIRFDRTPVLGAAVDIGTTSLSLNLFDLESGEFLGSSSALNPQTAYGGDVITRINYCREKAEGVSILRSVLIGQLELMLDEVLGKDRNRDQVHLMSAAGNTTMLHIMAGVNPLSLARAPFRPVFLKPVILEADRCGIPISPLGRLILLPGASAYVGADIVGGLTAIDYRTCSGCTLFIDIGTNGEIVLIEAPDRLLGTSCAMGPALEGMNISCGCRAVPGAVNSVTLDAGMLPRYTTIGDLPPIGICGSGLVDLVAALVTSGVIASSGAFNPDCGRGLTERLRGDRYYLTDNVFLNQRDIRQVQLAKSAAISGILTLLSEAGRSVAELEHIIVAGSFGYHLNPENLKRIGLLPEEYPGRITFVGNSSLSGASLALINQGILREMEHLASIIQVQELGSHPAFSKNFLSQLNFPNS
ncbi:2Fe-2S iron-sulfur cluster binding domain protein [Syntrophobacter sp. SbD1]|nr:2Fe-2S iron-sulfur cluster binding domain protein [Syntrophobacter sp. SbD1]